MRVPAGRAQQTRMDAGFPDPPGRQNLARSASPGYRRLPADRKGVYARISYSGTAEKSEIRAYTPYVRFGQEVARIEGKRSQRQLVDPARTCHRTDGIWIKTITGSCTINPKCDLVLLYSETPA